MEEERVESQTILIPQFEDGTKSLGKPLELLQKHLGNICVDNQRLRVKVWESQSFICIAPMSLRKKIDFDPFLFNSKGSDGIVRDIRVRFKKKGNAKSVFVVIKTGKDRDSMFEIFEAVPRAAS